MPRKRTRRRKLCKEELQHKSRLNMNPPDFYNFRNIDLQAIKIYRDTSPLSCIQQEPCSPEHSASCHSLHVASNIRPNTIGPGIAPSGRIIQYWTPIAKVFWDWGTHLNKISTNQMALCLLLYRTSEEFCYLIVIKITGVEVIKLIITIKKNRHKNGISASHDSSHNPGRATDVPSVMQEQSTKL